MHSKSSKNNSRRRLAAFFAGIAAIAMLCVMAIAAPSQAFAGGVGGGTVPIDRTIATPTIDSPLDGSVLIAAPAAISGTGVAGSTVRLDINGVSFVDSSVPYNGAAVVGDNGLWSVDVPSSYFVNESNTVEVMLVNSRGWNSDQVFSSFTIDPSSSSAPTFAITNPANGAAIAASPQAVAGGVGVGGADIIPTLPEVIIDTPVNGSVFLPDGVTTITGEGAGAGNQVFVTTFFTSDSGQSQTFGTTADAEGHWSVSPGQGVYTRDGKYTIMAYQESADKQFSPGYVNVTITIDSSMAPTFAITNPASGAVITSPVTMPVLISGEGAEPGNAVYVEMFLSSNPMQAWSFVAIAGADGTWQAVASPAAFSQSGTYTLLAYQQDSTGALLPAGAVSSVTVG
jgi:hypothetical protein